MDTRGALLILALCALPTVGQAAAQSVSLDGRWDLLLDPEDRGLAQPLQDGTHARWSQALGVGVPGAFETTPETVGYDGIVWYRRRIPDVPPAASADEHLLLEFDGCNVRADVWLDGRHLGRHDGADIPFAFDVTGLIEHGGPLLVVRVVDPGERAVDGLLLGALPHAKESWYFNYGGLTGSVRLRRAPAVEALHAELVPPRAPGEPGHLRLTLVNHAAAPRHLSLVAGLADTNAVDGDAWPAAFPEPDASPHDPNPTARADASPATRHAESDDSGPEVALGDDHVTAALWAGPGRSEWELPLPVDPDLPRWTPAQPSRVRLHLALHSAGDAGRTGTLTHSSQLTGLRRWEVRDGRFLLNGTVFRPWGVLWQPLFPAGLSNPPDPGFLRRELLAIKAAGFTLVRAHLRVMPELYALCDEIGLLVHAEPTLGWITTLRDETLPAVDDALVALADAVRGHPSVVMVGLLNELSGELFPYTAGLFERLHGLLPEHLALDDSGSWQGRAHHIGPGPGDALPCDDVHLYRAWPWTDDDFTHAASLGADHDELVYVSEYGFGGVPSFTAALVGHGANLWRADARESLDELAAVRQALANGSLPQVAGDTATVSLLGQLDQALAAQHMTAALLANPRVAGGVYTQWRDVSWECGAGLVDHWGGEKPALGALRRLLTDAEPQLPGALRRHPLPERERHPVAVGSAIALAGRVDQLVQALVSPPNTVGTGLPRIVVVGHRPNPWGPEALGTTLALLRHVQAGGVLLMLEPPDAGRPLPYFFFGYDGLGQVADLPFDVTAQGARGHFVGTHFVFRPHSRLLADLPTTTPLLDERWGDAKPHVVLATGPSVTTQVELLCLDGYGLPLGAAVQSVTFGKGRLVLSTLRFDDETLANPHVERLLENLVRFAASEAVGLPAPRGTLDSAPPAELIDVIGHDVWRTKIAFGLAERLTVQTFNGRRPLRDPPPDLPTLVARKNVGLGHLIAGRSEEAAAVLGMLDQTGLDPPRETFLRAEIELSRAFFESGVERGLLATLEAGRAHARSLRLMRLGETEGALGELRRATEALHAADATPPAPESEPP